MQGAYRAPEAKLNPTCRRTFKNFQSKSVNPNFLHFSMLKGTSIKAGFASRKSKIKRFAPPAIFVIHAHISANILNHHGIDRLPPDPPWTNRFMQGVDPQVMKPLLSNEHFSVDDTLIDAWPSHKSFRPRDGRGDGANFHGQARKNDTHASTTDPDSRLCCKVKERQAKLAYMGQAVMENRHGLVVDAKLTQADGTAERRTSEAMLKCKRRAGGITEITELFCAKDGLEDALNFFNDLSQQRE